MYVKPVINIVYILGRVLGAALNELNVNSFRQLSNRPKVNDMALIFTDGKSADDVSTMGKKLMDLNIKVKIVGIMNKNEEFDNRLDKEELMNVVQSSDDLIMLKNGFSDIATGLLDDIFHSDFCPAACRLASTACV